MSGAELELAPQDFTTITDLSQLHHFAETGRRIMLPARLEGVVCWTDVANGVLSLQDGSAAALLELDWTGQLIRPGDRVVLEGNCVIEGAKFSLRRPPLVDNDGCHPMQEKSGTTFLRKGRHPLRLSWFDASGQYGLEVYYQGPGLARQPVPDTALFRPVVDRLGGKTNWVHGLDYRVYEGRWERLPEFGQLKPARRGAVANFGLNVQSRVNNVGMEFRGYVEVPSDGLFTFATVSDDGSRLFIDEQAPRLAVIATNAWPRARPILPGQPLLTAEESQWSEVEGRVAYVAEKSGGWEIELRSATGRLSVQLPDLGGLSPALLPDSQIRAQGICQGIFTLEGQRLAGLLLASGLEQISVIQVAPGQWNIHPLLPIAEVLRTNLIAGTEGIVHVRGEVSFSTPEHSMVLRDATGQMKIELIQAAREELSGSIDVLGVWHRSGAEVILQRGLYRHIADLGEGGSEPLPVLTTIEQIHRLKREEAERRYPVLIRGVVTCAWPDNPNGIIQDSTRGIFVPVLACSAVDLARVGDFLEVEGFTGPGDFAPVIESKRVTRLGKGRLPEPARPSWDQLMNGSLDMQFVELEGLVVSVLTNGVVLLTRGGRIPVEIEDADSKSVAKFENARVSIRGALSAVWDPETHQVNSREVFMHPISISVVEPALADPFAARSKSPKELLQFDAQADALQRVKVTGQIVYQRNGEFYLMNQTNGLRFFAKGPVTLLEGDEVEVAGFPELGGPSPVLREAVVRVTGHARRPPARTLTADSLLSADYDATLVQVETQLINLSIHPFESVLELQTGTRSFVARLAMPGATVPKLRLGSRLRLTGVYAGQGRGRTGDRDLDSFELLLVMPGAIEVLEQPPWWTKQRTLAAVSGLSAILLLAVGWIRSLRRQVEQRTGELKTEMEGHKRAKIELEEKARLLTKEIEERRRMEAEVERIHQQLLTTSHQAGMAEVATSVLHNVGNVLNSVNISATLIAGKVRGSKESALRKVADLMQQQGDSLSQFISQDERGRQIPSFLGQLADRLRQEREGLLTEIEDLNRNVEHIKEIVAIQQNYACVAGVRETLPIAEVVEDAVRFHLNALERQQVNVVREFAALRSVTVDRHRVLQILVNLLSNAQHACERAENGERRITLRTISAAEETVRIQVSDNGVGITAENLTRIFAQGFTTRKDGHGFGLHSSALAAKELGGSLSVFSDGPGRGATFTLDLPIGSPEPAP
jgi:signal transduction histidine kinase